MPKTEAQLRATQKYNSKTYDKLSSVVPKGTKDLIKAAADAAGETISIYIANAIKMRMQAEGMPTEPAAEQIQDPEMETVTGGVKSYEIPGSHDMTKE